MTSEPADYGVPIRADGHPDFEGATYEVFNPDRTIGIAVDHRGSLKALHLAESTTKMNEAALQAEILKIAGVASLRASYSNRQRAEYWFGVRKEYLDPAYVTQYATRSQYDEAWRQAYGDPPIVR